MIRTLRVTIRVKDQDEGLRFYTEKLGFEKQSDQTMGLMRWVTVASKDDPAVELVLQPSDWFRGAEREEHASLIGKDPTIVFQVDNCRAAYENFSGKGVEFSTPPTERPYGVEAVGRDLYGNSLVFLQLPGTT